MDGKKKLEELVAGLDGVTPGPWDVMSSLLVRALDGDVAIPLFEPRVPWKKRKQTKTVMREEWHNAHHVARCDPDTIRSISDAYKAMEAERDELRRLIADRDYMLHAYRSMLGPKGREVADIWVNKGVQRIHFDWGPEAQEMSGEDRAVFLLELENTLWTPVDNIDAPEGGPRHEE